MTEKELNKYIYKISDRYEDINVLYLQKIGQHIYDIGQIDKEELSQIQQYLKMNKNIEDIKRMLVRLTTVTMNDFETIIDNLLVNEYNRNKYVYELRGKIFNDLKENPKLISYIESVKTLTKNSLLNVANTTVLDKGYIELVDKGIYAVSNGVEDYQSFIKDSLTEASNGARVKYNSNYTRRLDSAIRMNLLEGVRQVNNEIRNVSGEVFGADGVEISAHALCAPDHIPAQGKQYSKEAFEKLNSELNRPISTMNCRHITFPILLGINKPTYSEEELEQLKNNSMETFNINGKTYTRYQCSQLLRRLETAMRYSKDGYVLAKKVDNQELMKKYKDKVNKQSQYYTQICKKTGLPKEFFRAYVPNYR